MGDRNEREHRLGDAPYPPPRVHPSRKDRTCAIRAWVKPSVVLRAVRGGRHVLDQRTNNSVESDHARLKNGSDGRTG